MSSKTWKAGFRMVSLSSWLLNWRH